MDTVEKFGEWTRHLGRLHAAAGLGHFVVDPKTMTVEFSAWIRDILGIDDVPIPLAILPEIVPEEEREEFRELLTKLVEGREDFSFETRIMAGEGIRSGRVTGVCAFENDEAREGLIGYFGIVQETTSQKEAEDALREARDKAQAELAARNNLLAIVSHEIRNPLGGILGIIDQIKREGSASERERALSLIESSSEVLLDTLDAILQQARLEKSDRQSELKRFSPNRLAHRVAELFRPLARRKGLMIEVRASSDRPVMGHPERIQQVLSNLVSNAVKFTQSGSVSIHVDEPKPGSSEWRLMVVDTGPGMDEKLKAGLFEPFGGTSADSQGRSVGAGLGMSITLGLIEALGGRIEVESEPGQGASLTLVLPLEAAQERAEARDEVAASGTVKLIMDRASDKVQAEAIANRFGFIPVEADQSCADILVIDEDSFQSLAPAEREAFETIVLIGEFVGGDQPASGKGPIKIAYTQLARSLSEVFREVTSGPA